MCSDLFVCCAIENMKRNKSTSDVQSSTVNWKETFRKALKSNSEWPDKDELLDVVYWSR